jgi:predicted nucleic acid-binding protein
MSTVFADAYYFIALLNPRDSGHREAVNVPVERWQRIVTTEWVLIEAGNSMSAPTSRTEFVRVLDKLKNRSNVEIVYSARELFEAGLNLYRSRPDKGWSLTDCLSFSVMKERSIREALTADSHFAQAGFLMVLGQSENC